MKSSYSLIELISSFLDCYQFFPGSHSDTVPPDPIPNSEVKRISADGSVGLPHVRVGHCQVPLRKTRLTAGFLLLDERKMVKVLSTPEPSYILILQYRKRRDMFADLNIYRHSYSIKAFIDLTLLNVTSRSTLERQLQ